MVGLIAGPVTNLSSPLFYVTGCSTADWPKLRWQINGANRRLPAGRTVGRAQGGRVIHIGEVYG
jgi:hypothetical protein